MFGLGSVAWNACPVGDSDELRSGFRSDRDQRSGLTPISRRSRLKAESKIHSFPRLGGLHHRYAVAA